MKYKIKLLVCVSILTFLLNGCAMKEQVQENKQNIDKEDVKIENVNSDRDINIEQNIYNRESLKNDSDDYKMEYQPLKGDNFRNIGESIIYKDNQRKEISFTVKSVKYSKGTEGKQLGQLEKDSLDAYGIEYDEQGNIINDYSYIWMQVAVKPMEEDYVLNPIQFMIVTINEDNTLYQDIGPYLFYFDGIQETDDKAKNIFYKTLPKGVETEVSLGFFSQDKILDKQLGYLLSGGTVPTNPGENDFVIQLN